MKLLLHVCCGPCTTYPLTVLRGEGITVSGLFYNPNIHPYREFQKRLEALRQFADRTDFQVEIDGNYGLKNYLRQVVDREKERCGICYDMRLEETARQAKEAGAEAFSTTLLYSRYQNHQQIIASAERMAEKYQVPFYYRDFREGWQEGIDISVDMGLYRQPYCGCIYSEQERYDKSLRKKAKMAE